MLTAFSVTISCGQADKKTQSNTNSGVADTPSDSITTEAQASATKTILFFGNSLTAGMGLDTQEAFPAVIQRRIDSLGWDYKVINAGLSGETTAAGRNRVDWVMDEDVDVFVLELGANDGLRGVPLSETRENLEAIIEKVREKNPDVEIILAGMQIPPNLGEAYTKEFRAIFPELAEKKNVELIPFLLDGVAGNPDLNQDDGIHPTAEGQEIVAENVWDVLKEVIR
ncbi:arylesterase [Robertkochia aurantiaca]|uniref:arylesterase n=1 Tax=Robertkochia aurantiaca TaxID=2873700 RepID=UPI001CCDEB35